MGEKLEGMEHNRRNVFLKIINRFFPKKNQFLQAKNKKRKETSKEINIFSRRSFLQLSSFLTTASFLQLLIPKKAQAFGAFGLLRQGGATAPYIDDVFSAYTYTPVGGPETFINGIDLLGKGGLVWIKNRQSTYSNYLADTSRGAGNYLGCRNFQAA